MRGIESLIIVTGLSGAGKTAALNIFEDLEYITMDNIPCNFATIILGKYNSEVDNKRHKKIALGIDARSFGKIGEYLSFIDYIESNFTRYEIIFLDASNEAILNRYNLTRRRHPIVADTLLESITKERELMSPVKEHATRIIDTSFLSAKELGAKIKEGYYSINHEAERINIHVQSFGYKYGMPIDLDLAFDVRFLPNPYYIPELKIKNGKDPEVQEYVMNSEVSHEFFNKLMDMLRFLIPNYIKEGKKHLSIGIGCSGGMHRSVTLVNLISDELKKMKKVKVYRSHRENERGHW